MKLYYYIVALFNLANAGILLFNPSLFVSLWQANWSLTPQLTQSFSWWGATAVSFGITALALASASVGVQKQAFLFSILAYAANGIAAYRTMPDTVLPIFSVIGFFILGAYSYATTRNPAPRK